MRTIVLVAAVVAAFLLPAHAANPAADVIPRRYDKQFRGKISLRVGGYWHIVRHCGLGAWACADVGNGSGVCRVWIPRVGTYFGPGAGRVDAAGYRNLLRHETAHCNGWGADHPRS